MNNTILVEKCIIENIELIKASEVFIENISEHLLSKISERIAINLENERDWSTSNENSDYFGFKNWLPETGIIAGYKLHYENDDNGIESSWLSHALGVDNAAINFKFDIWNGKFKITQGSINRELERFLQIYPEFYEEGFKILKGNPNNLTLPFIFDKELFIAEYPNLDKSLTPLDEAFQRIVSATNTLNIFVECVKKNNFNF